MRRELWLLALAGCAPTVLWHGRSADRRVRVEVVERAGRQRVVAGDVEHPRFLAVGFQRLVVSRDGRRVAYPALTAEGWRAVVDGAAGPAYEGVGDVALSDDGAHVAYAALRAGRWRVVADGREGPAFASVAEGSLRYEGARLAYVARDGGGAAVVVDGAAGPRADAVRWLRFGDKGARVAYVARSGDEERAVVDGRAGPPYRRIAGLAVAARGTSVLYAGTREGGADLVRDGAVVASTEGEFAELRLSDDGAHAAWMQVDDRAVRVVVDGRTVGTHTDVEGGTFALQRGGHVVYVALEGGGRRVFRDGSGGPVFDAVTEAVALPGGRWGYVGRRGDAREVWADGRRARRERAWVGGLALSEEGSRYAYFTLRGAVPVVADDTGRVRSVGVALTDSLAFDRAGRRWGCLAGAVEARRVELVFEGGGRRAFDWDEVGAMLARGGVIDAETARRIVRAELEL